MLHLKEEADNKQQQQQTTTSCKVKRCRNEKLLKKIKTIKRVRKKSNNKNFNMGVVATTW